MDILESLLKWCLNSFAIKDYYSGLKHQHHFTLSHMTWNDKGHWLLAVWLMADSTWHLTSGSKPARWCRSEPHYSRANQYIRNMIIQRPETQPGISYMQVSVVCVYLLRLNDTSSFRGTRRGTCITQWNLSSTWKHFKQTIPGRNARVSLNILFNLPKTNRLYKHMLSLQPRGNKKFNLVLGW